jgi:cell division protein FtsB
MNSQQMMEFLLKEMRAWREMTATGTEAIQAETEATKARTEAIKARMKAMRENIGASHKEMVAEQT